MPSFRLLNKSTFHLSSPPHTWSGYEKNTPFFHVAVKPLLLKLHIFKSVMLKQKTFSKDIQFTPPVAITQHLTNVVTVKSPTLVQ